MDERTIQYHLHHRHNDFMREARQAQLVQTAEEAARRSRPPRPRFVVRIGQWLYAHIRKVAQIPLVVVRPKRVHTMGR